MSTVATQHIISGIDDILPRRIAIFDIDVDSVFQIKSEKILFRIIDDMNKKNMKDALPYINFLISMMEKKKIKYALGIFQFGSAPTAETQHASSKFLKEFGKSAMAFSYIKCIILDRERKNVIFFGKSDYDHSEPCVRERTDEQLRKIFAKYFNQQ